MNNTKTNSQVNLPVDLNVANTCSRDSGRGISINLTVPKYILFERENRNKKIAEIQIGRLVLYQKSSFLIFFLNNKR